MAGAALRASKKNAISQYVLNRMSETITESSIRDTDTHLFQYDAGADVETLFHIVNDLDSEITVEFYGTRQEDATNFSDRVRIGELTADSNVGDYETLSDNWEEVQIAVTATTQPSSDQVRIYAMT